MARGNGDTRGIYHGVPGRRLGDFGGCNQDWRSAEGNEADDLRMTL